MENTIRVNLYTHNSKTTGVGLFKRNFFYLRQINYFSVQLKERRFYRRKIAHSLVKI